jgi:hypothetical protein
VQSGLLDQDDRTHQPQARHGGYHVVVDQLAGRNDLDHALANPDRNGARLDDQRTREHLVAGRDGMPQRGGKLLSRSEPECRAAVDQRAASVIGFGQTRKMFAHHRMQPHVAGGTVQRRNQCGEIVELPQDPRGVGDASHMVCQCESHLVEQADIAEE